MPQKRNASRDVIHSQQRNQKTSSKLCQKKVTVIPKEDNLKEILKVPQTRIIRSS